MQPSLSIAITASLTWLSTRASNLPCCSTDLPSSTSCRDAWLVQAAGCNIRTNNGVQRHHDSDDYPGQQLRYPRQHREEGSLRNLILLLRLTVEKLIFLSAKATSAEKEGMHI